MSEDHVHFIFNAIFGVTMVISPDMVKHTFFVAPTGMSAIAA
jgi:hypothetical protein